jgi:hypothetical protein
MTNLTQDNELFAEEITRPKKKRECKRCWREIEKLKEKRRLSKELACNDQVYFDLLEEL